MLQFFIAGETDGFFFPKAIRNSNITHEIAPQQK